MQKNKLGKSNISVSELTLGCMSLGTNQQEAKYIIDAALDAGINHLDTADLYDFGLNEEIIGTIIKDKREQIMLTTKVGNHFNTATRDWFWDPSKKYIQSAVKASLRRLKTDYIDLYLLHGGTIEDPIDETIQAFEELKAEGIIRAYGLSSIRPNVIREYVKKANIDAVMMQYSLLDRRPEEQLLDVLHEHQICVLARGSLAKGILSSSGMKIITEKFPNGFLDYSTEELQTIYQAVIKEFGSSSSLHHLALKYVLHHPAVTSVVFGASSVEQIKKNTAVDLSSRLDRRIYTHLQQMTKPIQYTNHR